MEDQHLETTSTALTSRRSLGHIDEPQRQISSEDPRHLDNHRKRSLEQWTTYTLTLLQLEQTTDSSLAGGELAPRLSLVSPKVFSPFCHRCSFSFLAAVASGLLSWGHFISSTIIDLIAQILFNLS